ncbi:hypothetical protein [Paenibacillus xylanexedens]|uniref:hypothetical protein n=1 Tax=Paenibacillus xylanexedens TaxID=528191 RepID=UPI0011A2EC1F|nr:hypothetical protein [Paenibacillus xylanexedens]
MAGTIIEQIIKEIVEDQIISKPENGPLLINLLRDLRNGKYSKDIVNAIMQKPRNMDFDIYEAYCFLQVWSGLLSGKIATARIITGIGPKKDADIEGNNAILSKLLHPFKAEFIPSNSGSDGYFEWLEPLRLQTQNILLKNSDQIQQVQVESNSIPLEVGYTSAYKTYEYMSTEIGAVARYPYNSNHIYIFYNLDFEKDLIERTEKMYEA